MSGAFEVDPRDLLLEADDLPYGPAQIALAERIVDHVEARGLTEVAFEARLLATRAYQYGGEPAKSLASFTACLDAFDRDPSRHAGHLDELLWQYTSTVATAIDFPQVPLPRLHHLLDDLQRRLHDAGGSPHAVFARRHQLYAQLGDNAAAQSWYEQWCDAPRDRYADCDACMPMAQARWLAGQGRDEEALAVAEPVLAGQLTCPDQPHGILTALLLPLLRTGRLEQARDAHRRAYLLLGPADLTEAGRHVQFCALTGNAEHGRELVWQYLPALEHAPSPYAAMSFAGAAALLLQHAGEPEPAQELATRALELAGHFDARNGTDEQSRSVLAQLGAAPLVAQLPLAPPGSRTRPSAVDSPHATEEAPPPVAEPVAAPASPDELLDLAEAAQRGGRPEEASAASRAFEQAHAGAALSSLQRGRFADLQGVLAAEAGDFTRAEAYWQLAQGHYAAGEHEEERQAVLGSLGVLLIETGSAEQGLSMVEASTSYLTEHGPRQRWCGACAMLARALSTVGRPDEALAQLERLDDAVLDAAPRETAVYALVQRATLLEQQGRADAAIETYERAVARETDLDARNQLRFRRAGLLAGSPRAAEAVDDLVEIVADRSAAEDLAIVAAARYCLAVAYLNAGRLLDAAELAEELVAGEYPPRDARHLLATVCRLLDRPDAAIVQLRALAQECAAEAQFADAGAVLAEIGLILDRGDRDREASVEFLASAQAYARAGRALDEVTNRRRNATSLLWAGDLTAAEAALVEVDTAAAALPEQPPAEWDRPQDWPMAVQWERAAVDFDAARIFAATDRVRAALDRAGRSVELFRGIGAVYPASHSGALLGSLLLRDGRPLEAEAVAQAALDVLPDEGSEREALLELLAASREQLGNGDQTSEDRDRSNEDHGERSLRSD